MEFRGSMTGRSSALEQALEVLNYQLSQSLIRVGFGKIELPAESQTIAELTWPFVGGGERLINMSKERLLCVVIPDLMTALKECKDELAKKASLPI